MEALGDVTWILRNILGRWKTWLLNIKIPETSCSCWWRDRWLPSLNGVWAQSCVKIQRFFQVLPLITEMSSVNCRSATDTQAVPWAWRLCPDTRARGSSRGSAPCLRQASSLRARPLHRYLRQVSSLGARPLHDRTRRILMMLWKIHNGTFPARSLRGPGGGRDGLAAHRGGRGRAPTCRGGGVWLRARVGILSVSWGSTQPSSAALGPLRPFSPPSVFLSDPLSPPSSSRSPPRHPWTLSSPRSSPDIPSAPRISSGLPSAAAEMDDEPERTKRWEGGYERTWCVPPPSPFSPFWRKRRKSLPSAHCDSLFCLGKFLRKTSPGRWRQPSRIFSSRQRGKGTWCGHEPA